MTFFTYSPRNIAFCDNIQMLARALINRSDAECVIYSGETYAELLQLAYMIISESINKNTNTAKHLEQMALPANITEPTFLTYTPPNLPTVTRTNQCEDWAISALNGFCTASSTRDLCRLFEGNGLIYPIAIWTDNHETAIMMARNNYVNRFCQRYNPQYERLDLPQIQIEYFQDKYFYEREKRLQVRIEETKRWQQTMFRYGWY